MKNIFAALILGVILLTQITYPQGFRDGCRFFPNWQLQNYLNLTDEQQSAIQSLHLKHQKDMIDLRSELEKQELELQELRSSGNYTREDFLNKKKQVIEARDKICLARAEHQMDIYELLDPSQKEQWNKLPRPRHRNRMHGDFKRFMRDFDFD